MWSETSGTSSIWSAIAIIVIIWAIFGGGLLGGARTAYASDVVGCDRVSNCQVEKTEIINTATTQFKILEDGEKTRNQASLIRNEQQAEKIFDLKQDALKTAILDGQEKAELKAEINALKQQIYNDRRFGELERGQERISCEMPKRPPYYAQGFINCGQPIPSSNCGF